MAIWASLRPRGATSGAELRAGSVLFDYTVLAAALWFIGGLLVDGWAHNNLDLSKEGFFTPYHALFYSGFAAVAAVVLAGTWQNRRSAPSWRAAIPRGYEVTVAGLAIFALGGALDMAWHLTFGIEQDIEALFSPTHLILAVGIASILTGPIQAALTRAPERSWRAEFPALAALALFATLVTFFFMWAFGTAASSAADPHRLYPALGAAALDELRTFKIEHGIAAVIFRSLVAVAFVLWAARRLQLPRGAAALLIVVPSVLIGTMMLPQPLWIATQFAAAAVAGIVAELFLARSLERGAWTRRAFGFTVPFTFWATYMGIAYFTGNGFWWSSHVVYGSPVIAGLGGLLLAIAIEPYGLVTPGR